MQYSVMSGYIFYTISPAKTTPLENTLQFVIEKCVELKQENGLLKFINISVFKFQHGVYECVEHIVIGVNYWNWL